MKLQHLLNKPVLISEGDLAQEYTAKFDQLIKQISPGMEQQTLERSFTSAIEELQAAGDDPDEFADAESTVRYVLSQVEQAAADQDETMSEALNHMGDKEYQSHASWKTAVKKAYPTCTFRGDKDIGAAVVDGKDVGEWDGAVGCVYAKKVTESNEMVDKIKEKLKQVKAELRSYPSSPKTQDEYDAIDDAKAEIKKLESELASVRTLKEAEDSSFKFKRELLSALMKKLHEKVSNIDDKFKRRPEDKALVNELDHIIKEVRGII